MKFLSVVTLVFALLGFQNSAFAGPNDSQLTEREQTQQDIEKNRQEVQNAGTPKNSSSTPTKINVDSWGIDSTARFDITNHLFGYSTLLDQDTAFDGVKLTGFINLGFYSPRKNNDGTRKKGRIVMGFEEPVWDITSRAALFLGGGATFGDHTGLYLDTGFDFHLLSWAKAQAGLNYATGSGHVSPQLSIGFTW